MILWFLYNYPCKTLAKSCITLNLVVTWFGPLILFMKFGIPPWLFFFISLQIAKHFVECASMLSLQCNYWCKFLYCIMLTNHSHFHDPYTTNMSNSCRCILSAQFLQIFFWILNMTNNHQVLEIEFKISCQYISKFN